MYFVKNLSVQIFFYDHSPNFCKKNFLLLPFFATLEKYARFARACNFARAPRAKNFLKKIEFIKGSTSVMTEWPEKHCFARKMDGHMGYTET